MAENKIGPNLKLEESSSSDESYETCSEGYSDVNEVLDEHESREEEEEREEMDEINRLGVYDILEIEVKRNTLNTKDDKMDGKKEAKCESYECMFNMTGKFALYLCFICNIYLCDECLKVHDGTHDFVRVESEENERKSMNERLLERMRREIMSDREFNKENIKVCGRVNVKHELDKEDSWITGLCGLQDKRWVVLDSNNSCIKIFSSVTNTLLRYVRFGSRPRDVTEIKQKFTDPNSAAGSKSDVSGAARDDQDKHCLLAVTFPRIKQIWFIDVNQTPATKTKTIEMQNLCFSIDFSEDKIFTLCEENVGSGSRDSVDILSAKGNPLKVIQVDFRPDLFPTDLAVYKHKIYVTDHLNNKVFCINVENGKTISELSIERLSWLAGICVDPSNNVFVCGWLNNKVYKLSPDLRGFEPLNLDTEFTWGPFKICFTDGKLFVSHNLDSPPLCNTVTVVQLT